MADDSFGDLGKNSKDILLVERIGKILKLVINRPERGNSLSPRLVLALRNELLKAQEDRKISVIILTGSGEKDFTTGIDIGVAGKLSSKNRTNLANLAGDIATILHFGKPSVIGLNGRTMGMGVVFSVAADFRLAREGIRLRMPEVNSGIFPGGSCIALMGCVIGPVWARRILMFGDYFDLDFAMKAGIVDEVSSPDMFQKLLVKRARELARKNPALLYSIKKAISLSEFLDYNCIVRLESLFSDYYLWDDPIKAIGTIVKDVMDGSDIKSDGSRADSDTFSGFARLTGNPELLLEELDGSD